LLAIAINPGKIEIRSHLKKAKWLIRQAHDPEYIEGPISVRPAIRLSDGQLDSLEEVPTCGRDSSDPAPSLTSNHFSVFEMTS